MIIGDVHPRKATCSRCGKQVWLRKVGTNGHLNAVFPRMAAYQWCARRGSKPPPIQCPINTPGYSFAYHEVAGQPMTTFVDPETGEVVGRR